MRDLTRVLRFELRIWRLKLPILPLNYTLIKVYFDFYNKTKNGRKVIRTPICC